MASQKTAPEVVKNSDKTALASGRLAIRLRKNPLDLDSQKIGDRRTIDIAIKKVKPDPLHFGVQIAGV